MIDYSPVTITISFLLLCPLPMTDTQFNLDHTNQSSMMSTFGSHCLYVDPLKSSMFKKNPLESYCMRSEQQSKNEEKRCYGTPTTFEGSKRNNVNIVDLFYWNSVIDTIDLYEKISSISSSGWAKWNLL